ncbi:MAG: hypothetical protein EOO24_08670 [Comamonadaceae bacterium]|nr:MAG: hypothetical protein EOO24_08670 [Comamonadaceae bacterium]
MNTTATAADPRTRQTFILYAAEGRVLASNARQKLIDLGSLSDEGGRFGYRLDGDDMEGRDFASVDAALQDLGKRIGFLHLDGQFTALADLRDGTPPNLEHAARVEIDLDELAPGEPAVKPNA